MSVNPAVAREALSHLVVIGANLHNRGDGLLAACNRFSFKLAPTHPPFAMLRPADRAGQPLCSAGCGGCSRHTRRGAAAPSTDSCDSDESGGVGGGRLGDGGPGGGGTGRRERRRTERRRAGRRRGRLQAGRRRAEGRGRPLGVGGTIISLCPAFTKSVLMSLPLT